MLISEESFDRVKAAVDDIKDCCEIEDDYMEWEDIASFSIMTVLEELDEHQLRHHSPARMFFTVLLSMVRSS